MTVLACPLRAAGPFDAETIALFQGECLPDGRDERWTAAAIAEALGRPGGFGWLAVAGGSDPIGYLIGWLLAGEAEILSFGVIEAWRRRGVGRRMLDSAVGHAKESGASRVLLEVAADNTAALALYARADFRAVGRRRGYYRRSAGPAVDAMILSRDL